MSRRLCRPEGTPRRAALGGQGPCWRRSARVNAAGSGAAEDPAICAACRPGLAQVLERDVGPHAVAQVPAAAARLGQPCALQRAVRQVGARARPGPDRRGKRASGAHRRLPLAATACAPSTSSRAASRSIAWSASSGRAAAVVEAAAVDPAAALRSCAKCSADQNTRRWLARLFGRSCAKNAARARPHRPCSRSS